MKKILMIATGGTIASKNSGAGLAPAISSKELLACVPELKEKCEIETLQPFNLDSTNLYAPHWLALVRIIEENYSGYDGFVITHGTDTMAYTAAALSYLIENCNKPIVLTGSQKSAYLRDTDARKNLYDAFSYCADDGAHGVHVVFDGKVILGTRAKKTRTQSFNAFSSVDFPEIAILRDGEPLYYIRDAAPVGEPKFYHALNEKVFVLKMIPGMRAEILDYLGEYYDGIVIESFGAGGLPNYEDDAFYTSMKGLLDMGKTVVLTTQVEREGSTLDKYEVGRRIRECGNVLEARCMTLEATVVKLMCILSRAKSEREVEELFYRPVNRDIF